MKKLIIVIALAATFAACKKNEVCYNCTYGVYGGVIRPADEYCGDINNYHPKAPDGADLSFFCTPK